MSDVRRSAARYSTSSINRRDTAVTTFRGLTRSDSASNQFLNPGIRGEVDVFSLGGDRKPGGEGIDADIGSWQ